jgi:hypothetical protein
MSPGLRNVRPDGVTFGFLRVMNGIIIVLGAVLLGGILVFDRVPHWFYKVYAFLMLVYLVVYSVFFCLGIYMSLKAVLIRVHGNVRIVRILLPSMVLGFVTLIVVSFCFLNYYQRDAARTLRICAGNLEATGLMLKARKSAYPPGTKDLEAGITEPRCPMAEKGEHSVGYEVNQESTKFTLYCKGRNHSAAGVPANYPQYSSEKGIILKP